MKNKGQIDFSKIWKEAHNTGEDIELQEWKSESEENERFFNDAHQFYNSGSSFDMEPVESKRTFKQIIKRINSRRFFRMAGSAAAVLVIGIAGYFIIESQLPDRIQSAQHLSPGKDQATLILNNGKTVELTKEKEIVLKEKGTQIKSDGKTLAYQAGSKSKRKRSKISYNTLRVPRGGKFFLVLSDSTQVWLNSETTLKYPVNFVGDSREVELVGEAYFEVTKDTGKPFYVKSHQHKIRVLGTSFNVSAYVDDQFIKTTLVEGQVEVNCHDELINLEPSFQSVFDVQNGNIVSTLVNTEYFTAWKDGNYFFDNENLDLILKTLSRWYDFEYDFEDQMTKNLRFTGSFSRDQELDNILLIIEQTQRIKITAYGKKLVIK